MPKSIYFALPLFTLYTILANFISLCIISLDWKKSSPSNNFINEVKKTFFSSKLCSANTFVMWSYMFSPPSSNNNIRKSVLSLLNAVFTFSVLHFLTLELKFVFNKGLHNVGPVIAYLSKPCILFIALYSSLSLIAFSLVIILDILLT